MLADLICCSCVCS